MSTLAGPPVRLADALGSHAKDIARAAWVRLPAESRSPRDLAFAAYRRRARRVMRGDTCSFRVVGTRTVASSSRSTVVEVELRTRAEDYVQAQRLRPLIRQECADAFGAAGAGGVDVLVVPTMPITAPKFEGYNPDSMMRSASFTPIWNLTGLPAISIPCGFSAGGLPIGMQVVGRPFDEPTVFKIADAYQQITNWHLTVPPIAKEAQPA